MLISRHRWCKQYFTSYRGVHFLELSYFRKLITFIPIFKVVKVIGIHRGHFGQRKEKEMMLSSYSLNCFKTKYQLVKSVTQTLF